MFESLRLSADARDLAFAFEGSPASRPKTSALLRVANELASVALVPCGASAVDSARSTLRQAVLAESARRTAHPGPAARARAAVVGAAAVAGAGLIVASAANGSGPVTAVRQAVDAITYASDASLPSPTAVTLDGVVLGGVKDGELTVSADGETLQVRISSATVIRDSEGNSLAGDALVRGVAIRLAGVRRGDAVLASTIAVRTVTPAAKPGSDLTGPSPASNANAAGRPAAATSLPPTGDATPTPTTASRPVSASGAVVPRPAAVAKPTATATPTASPPSAVAPVSSSNMAPTPTATPSRTPAPVTSSVQGAQVSPRPSAKSQLTP